MKGKMVMMGLFVLAAAFVFGAFLADAQSKPEVITTWTASSYAPSDYNGKILPSVGSSVLVSFEALSGGKVLNLAKQMVYWYLNDNLVASGEGVQDITFKAVQAGPVNLRFQASSPAGAISRSLVVVVANPKVEIGGFPAGGVVTGNGVQLEAKPYFFNAPDIGSFDLLWKVNGKEPKNTDNPRFLNITVGEGVATDLSMNVSLTAKTRATYPEAASKSIQLSIGD